MSSDPEESPPPSRPTPKAKPRAKHTPLNAFSPAERDAVDKYRASHPGWDWKATPELLTVISRLSKHNLDKLLRYYREGSLPSAFSSFAMVPHIPKACLTPTPLRTSMEPDQRFQIMAQRSAASAPPGAIQAAMDRFWNGPSVGPSPPAPSSEPTTAPPIAGYEKPDVLSWIGDEHIFFIAAPCFPFADGPTATRTLDGTGVDIEWEWPPLDTQTESSLKASHSWNVLCQWGLRAKAPRTPGCKLQVHVHAPTGYFLLDRCNSVERTEHDVEVVYQFTTNRSRSRFDDHLVAPRVHVTNKPETHKRLHIEEVSDEA